MRSPVIIILLIIIIVDIQSKPIRTRGRQHGAKVQKKSCDQEGQENRRFRNSQGLCLICVNCETLGLKTKQSCSDFRDETCYNECIDQNAVYDREMRLCYSAKPDVSSLLSSSMSPSLSPVTFPPEVTPPYFQDKSSTTISLQSQYSPGGWSQKETILLFTLCIVAAVLGTLISILVACAIRKNQANKSDEAKIPLSHTPNAIKAQPAKEHRKKRNGSTGTPDCHLQQPLVCPGLKSLELQNQALTDTNDSSEASAHYETIDETQL